MGEQIGARVELVVVIVVITILATLVAPNVFRHVNAAKETTARSQIEMLSALWQQPSGDPRSTN